MHHRGVLSFGLGSLAFAGHHSLPEWLLVPAGCLAAINLPDPIGAATFIVTVGTAIGLAAGAGRAAYLREKTKADREAVQEKIRADREYAEANKELLTGQLAEAIAKLDESVGRTRTLTVEQESMRARLSAIEAERDSLAKNLCDFAIRVLQEKGFVADLDSGEHVAAIRESPHTP